MSQYTCFKCQQPIRFDKEWKDDEGKSIPLELDKDVPHKHKIGGIKVKQQIENSIRPSRAASLDYDYSKTIDTSIDKLEQIFQMQEALDIRIVENMEQPLRGGTDEWISMTATAIMHEALELHDLTNWKWWKRHREFDKQKAIEEVIDIWHFVVSASIELGLKPHDILREYERKNEIRHET